MASLRAERDRLEENDIKVLGISVDAPETQIAFADSLDLHFPLIPDVGRNLSILYGAANDPNQLASRMSVLIDKQGVVRWIDKHVDVRTHGADVLAKVSELGMVE